MPKTVVFTTITPLSVGITRKSVRDMYKNHIAMIDLNPLVVERFACRPPSYAPTDEYWSSWYTIKDRVSYLPGGLAQGSVSYHACFHDVDDGLHTHIYAPLGLEIQGKWSVGGRLPGEPKPPAEPGLNTPRHGLYIREDVKMTCSSLLLGFVRKTFKDSHARLVDRLVERAHILESNFANERLQALRNVDPSERMGHGDIFIAPPPDYDCMGQIVQTPSPRYLTHLRCHSDPVLSPGFSSSSTLYERNENTPSPSKSEGRPMSLRLAAEDKIEPCSAPDTNTFLLPSTTYNYANDLTKRISPPSSPCPSLRTERIISLLPFSPLPPKEDLDTTENTPQASNEHDFPLNAPHLSYHPSERPLSFPLSFDPQSPFDKRSTSESSSSAQYLLNDIDDAIDEVFKYTSPPPAFKGQVTQAKKCDILPAATFNASNALTKISCPPKAERARKDAVVPLHEYVDKELPALPPAHLKDEKWRRQLGI